MKGFIKRQLKRFKIFLNGERITRPVGWYQADYVLNRVVFKNGVVQYFITFCEQEKHINGMSITYRHVIDNYPFGPKIEPWGKPYSTYGLPCDAKLFLTQEAAIGFAEIIKRELIEKQKSETVVSINPVKAKNQ